MGITRIIGAAAALTLALVAGRAEARPPYFDAFKALYGINSGDRLDACGVCHYKWTGTGARNLFGSAVEQQLYLGKSVTQSLMDIESADTDGDGYTNLEEIATYMTLPGYNCDNYYQAIGAPTDYYTYITPFVPTCLVPIDIRVSVESLGVFLAVGETEVMPVEIFNNGSTFDIDISSYELLAGSDPAYTLSGPTFPLTIPVGSSVIVDVVYQPTIPGVQQGTLRINSNDPDPEEAVIDIPINSLSFVKNVADPADRNACLRYVARQYSRYSKQHLRTWARCYLDEVGGQACDVGKRDLKILSAQDQLRAHIGGAKDKKCAGSGLTPSLLDLPTTCGGGCDSISVSSLATYADCLICREDEAMQQILLDSVGTAPPDLPANTAGSAAAEACQSKLVKGAQKAVVKIQKTLDRCEADNIVATSPVDCAAANASRIANAQATADATIEKCSDTSGLAGCLFEVGADPQCLGNSAASVATDLVDTVFGLSP